MISAKLKNEHSFALPFADDCDIYQGDSGERKRNSSSPTINCVPNRVVIFYF